MQINKDFISNNDLDNFYTTEQLNKLIQSLKDRKMKTIKVSTVGERVELDGQLYQVKKVEGSVAFISKCVEVSPGVFVSKKGRPSKVLMQDNVVEL